MCSCLFKSHHNLNVGIKSPPTPPSAPRLWDLWSEEGHVGSFILALPRFTESVSDLAKVKDGARRSWQGRGRRGFLLDRCCPRVVLWPLSLMRVENGPHPCGNVHDSWDTAPQDSPKPQPPGHRQSPEGCLSASAHGSAPHRPILWGPFPWAESGAGVSAVDPSSCSCAVEPAPSVSSHTEKPGLQPLSRVHLPPCQGLPRTAWNHWTWRAEVAFPHLPLGVPGTRGTALS